MKLKALKVYLSRMALRRVRLNTRKLTKLTGSCSTIHTLMTLLEKKFTLTLLHLDLYNLYACPLVFVTEETRKTQQSLISQVSKTIL